MTAIGWLQILAYCANNVVLTPLLGHYISLLYTSYAADE